MNTIDNVSKKVQSLFRDLVGDVALQLDGHVFPDAISKRIAEALYEDFDEETAKKIAFHLVDWNSDAAFLVALHLWPGKFSKKEINEYLYRLIPHTPDHLAAAAKLFGTPITDVFEVGALDGEDEETQESNSLDN